MDIQRKVVAPTRSKRTPSSTSEVGTGAITAARRDGNEQRMQRMNAITDRRFWVEGVMTVGLVSGGLRLIEILIYVISVATPALNER
jgi:hypothetical protein